MGEIVRPQGQNEVLIAELRESLRVWDEAYIVVLNDFDRDGEKKTEERLKIGVRNELRQRGVELPEIVRWKLRAAIGYRTEEE